MAKTLEEKINGLSKARRDRIDARASELISEEMAMRDLRKALHLTQKDVAKKLRINQDNVSRLEARTDILLSTLQCYVRALGGELRLIAKFPNRPPVALTGLASIIDKDKHSVNRKRAVNQ